MKEEKKYRCQICGEIVTPLPDGTCPVCGASFDYLDPLPEKENEN